jgi:thioredoxin-related protein
LKQREPNFPDNADQPDKKKEISANSNWQNLTSCKNQKLARKLGASSAPSYIFFKNGNQIEQFSGDRVDRNIIEDFVSTLSE